MTNRNTKQITNTNDLVKIIENSKKNYSNKINPCTKTFQAIRIFVNKDRTPSVINATKVRPRKNIVMVSPRIEL